MSKPNYNQILIDRVPLVKGNPGDKWVDIGKTMVTGISDSGKAAFFAIFKRQAVPVSQIARDENFNFLISAWKYNQLVDALIEDKQ